MTSIRPTHIIARRKGIKVRLFDVARAKMGPWMTDPQAERERDLREHGPAVAARAKLPVLHNRGTLEGMRVADIRIAAQTVFGETFKAKARKAEMIGAYLSLQTARIEEGASA